MQDLVDKAVSPRRFIMWLLTAFAVQALVLACSRHLRRRLVLGERSARARSASAWRSARRAATCSGACSRETLMLAAVGAVLGLIGAFAAARIITSLLFGLSSTDPATFVGMIAVLSAVALIAGYISRPPRVTHRRDDGPARELTPKGPLTQTLSPREKDLNFSAGGARPPPDCGITRGVTVRSPRLERRDDVAACGGGAGQSKVAALVSSRRLDDDFDDELASASRARRRRRPPARPRCGGGAARGVAAAWRCHARDRTASRHERSSRDRLTAARIRLRLAHAAQDSRLHARHHQLARARHRRQHRRVHAAQRGAAADTSGSRAGNSWSGSRRIRYCPTRCRRTCARGSRCSRTSSPAPREWQVRLTISRQPMDPTGAAGAAVTDRQRANQLRQRGTISTCSGSTPQLGRFIRDDEDRLPQSAESHGSVAMPQRRILGAHQFGRDPGVLGRVIHVNRSPCRVIGVAPRGFIGEAVGGRRSMSGCRSCRSHRRAI